MACGTPRSLNSQSENGIESTNLDGSAATDDGVPYHLVGTTLRIGQGEFFPDLFHASRVISTRLSTRRTAMPETYDLVLRGGGIKGVAFVGALQVLAQAKHRVRRMIGTSAGAIFAACYAAGFSPEEM